MNYHLRGPARRTAFPSRLPWLLCLALSACGGGGDSYVASIPPPPPPPTVQPPGLAAGTTVYPYPANHPVVVQTSWLDSPTTRLGTTDVIGRLTLASGTGSPSSTRAVPPGEFSITTAQPFAQQSTWGNLQHQYALTSTAGVFPAGLTSIAASGALISWDINDTVAYRYVNPYGDTPQYFGQRLSGFTASGTQLFSYDYTRTTGGARLGFSPNEALSSTLDYDIGYSYVAMGEWSWHEVDLSGNALPGTDSGDLLFVNGDRTPASGIPVSGTATYDARSFALSSSSGTPGIPFTMTADFGQRLMSTRIDQDYQDVSPVDGPILGIHVGGTAPFSNNGLFDIPLTGTANYDNSNLPSTPPSQPVSGMMNGAFFGPHAEQVGGTFSLQNAGGAVVIQDAFVGQQRH